MQGKGAILLLELKHVAKGHKLYLQRSHMKERCGFYLAQRSQVLARSTSKPQNEALHARVPIHLHRSAGPRV